METTSSGLLYYMYKQHYMFRRLQRPPAPSAYLRVGKYKTCVQFWKTGLNWIFHKDPFAPSNNQSTKWHIRKVVIFFHNDKIYLVNNSTLNSNKISYKKYNMQNIKILEPFHYDFPSLVSTNDNTFDFYHELAKQL